MEHGDACFLQTWPAEFHSRFTHSFLVFAPAGLIGATVMAGTLWLALATVVGMLGVFGAMWLYEVRRAPKLTSKLDDFSDGDLAATLIERLPAYSSFVIQIASPLRGPRAALCEAARQLARRGFQHTAIRIGDPRDGFDRDWPALEHPFEPAHLRPRNPVLNELAQGELPKPSAKEVLNTILNSYGRSRTARIVGGGLLLFAFASFGWTLWNGAADMLRGMGIPQPLMPLLIVWPIAIAVSLLRLWRRRQWLIVPGGVVIRTALWYEPNWRLTRIAARDGVLVYWREARLLIVANTAGDAYVAPAMADTGEIAVRAWRSPLEPPPIERLSDWT